MSKETSTKPIEVRLPGTFMDRYLKKGMETFIFGQPIRDMNKEQLIATVGCVIGKMERDATSAQEHITFLNDISAIRRGQKW